MNGEEKVRKGFARCQLKQHRIKNPVEAQEFPPPAVNQPWNSNTTSPMKQEHRDWHGYEVERYNRSWLVAPLRNVRSALRAVREILTVYRIHGP